MSATFATSPIVPKLDVDANNQSDPLTDGLLILRFMFGHSGPGLTADALGANATRSDPAVLESYLIDIAPYLDADGNGEVDALTDGVLIFRYLTGGFSDAALIEGAIGPSATRSTRIEITSHLDTLVP